MAELLSSITILILFSIYFWSILKKKKWCVFTYTLLWLLFYYVLIPVVNNLGLLLKFDMQTYGGVIDSSFINQVIISVFIMSYIISYRITTTSVVIPINRSVKTTNKYENLKILSYFLAVLSFISLLLYINGFGGLSKAVFYANSVRTGHFRLTNFEDIGFLFYKRFIFLALLPLLVFFSEKKYRKMLDKLVLFLLPLVTLFILYLLLNRGRQIIIDFILIIIFAGLLKKNITFNRWLLLGVIVSILLLNILNVLFYAMSIGDIAELLFSNNRVTGTIDYYGEFAHPMLSLNKAMSEPFDFYYFSDFLYGIFGSFLPSQSNFFGEEIVYLNSQLIINKFDSVVPPGIIASGYYNLGVAGVIFSAILLGFLVKKLDSFFADFIKIKYGFRFIYAYVIVFSSTIIRVGIPRYYFYEIVFVSLFLLLIFSFHFKKVSRY